MKINSLYASHYFLLIYENSCPMKSTHMNLTSMQPSSMKPVAKHAISHPVELKQPLDVEINIPGDKSISHRALILASQTIGTSKISNLLESEDVLNTLLALQKLGIRIEKIKKAEEKESKLADAADATNATDSVDYASYDYIVYGNGTGGLLEPSDMLDLGNSGTGVRLLMGLVAPYSFQTYFTGDASLQKRDMARIINPLQEMGAEFTYRNQGLLPISVKGFSEMLPITYRLPIASAQVKSAILLAALNIAGITKIIEPEPSRNHTENMLKYLDVDISITPITQPDNIPNSPDGEDCLGENMNAERAESEGDKGDARNAGKIITIKGQPEIMAKDFTIPADPSSAAFFVAYALLAEKLSITMKNICLNPLRAGFFEAVKKMGANIEFLNRKNIMGENIADVRASFTEGLQAIELAACFAPSMIDEYPILAILCARATGTSKLHGLKELTVKECNRLEVMQQGLEACGIKCEVTADYSLIIEGCASKKPASKQSTSQQSSSQPVIPKIKTHLDHRIAMSFLILGSISQQPIQIDDAGVINTSFPNFIELFTKAGGKVTTA